MANKFSQAGVLCEITEVLVDDRFGDISPDHLTYQQAKNGCGLARLGHIVRVRPCLGQPLTLWLLPFAKGQRIDPVWNLAIGAHEDRLRIATSNGLTIEYDNGLWLEGCRVLCDITFDGSYTHVQRLYPLPKGTITIRGADPRLVAGLTLDWEYGLRQVEDGRQCQFNFDN